VPTDSDVIFHHYVAELTRLAAAQIRASMIESSSSVDDLSLAFTGIVEQDRLMRNFIGEMPNTPETLTIKNKISELSQQMSSNVLNATVAFQFYDRLCQKLDHSSELLRQLSEIEDKESSASVDKVISLKQSVFNNFTMAEERQLFDAVLSSDSFEQALDNFHRSHQSSITEEDDDIEFF